MQGLLFQFLTMKCCCKIFEVKLPSLTSWQSGVRIFSTMKCEKSKLLLEKKKTRKISRVLIIMIRPCRILIRFWVGSTIWKRQYSPNWLIHILTHVNEITKLFLFLLLILYSFVNKKFREIDLYLISRVFLSWNFYK